MDQSAKQELANKIEILMMQLDFALQEFTDEDIKNLEQVSESILSKIGYNSSVSIVAVAMGGELYDCRVDAAKREEAECLIALLKARKTMQAALKDRASEKAALKKKLKALYR